MNSTFNNDKFSKKQKKSANYAKNSIFFEKTQKTSIKTRKNERKKKRV